MSKQEEIREKLAEYMYNTVCGIECHGAGGWGQTYKDDATEEEKNDYRRYANTILSHLHSQGAVLKVDRELPITEKHIEPIYDEHSNGERSSEYWIDVPSWAYEMMVRAGYVAVEPLIED